MNKLIFYIVFINILISCKDKNNHEVLTPIVNTSVNDSKYSVNDFFPKGDVRRYGVFPNQKISQKKLKHILLLASSGLPITFPKGSYKTSLVLDSVANIKFIFQDVTINGAINILDGSSKIKFEGKLTILDRLFIRKSNNITFDTIILKSDTLANLYHKRNRGVSIYAGSKNISFNTLKINDTGGSEDNFYTHTAAALQIHGWNNNPEHVYIKKLEITDAGRTALYITGNGHYIGSASITNFGLGSSEKMFGLEDANLGEEKEFTGAWVNRCNNCVIDTLEINSIISKETYSLRLDEGVYHKPTFINNIHFGTKVKRLPIKDDLLTNILVKNEY